MIGYKIKIYVEIKNVVSCHEMIVSRHDTVVSWHDTTISCYEKVLYHDADISDCNNTT